ncbi:GAF domain-containing protein [Natronomonas salina]|uniref:bacterio-opsin activator domain-containing protein n=1 Tax=Natronomonas salina TaxID=1710540 RepID=UPI0015B4DAB3|nr:bacterio-opsin activator domain-containing protein [Natronomonas salina]QLD87820.1 GAF domain-containing protein [Natronomonas salina]
MTQETSPHTLLIEDNPGDARYIRELLQEAQDVSERRFDGGGMLAERPVDADHGDETLVHETELGAGLERLESEPFDVVLLDLNLPDSAGLDTLTAARDQVETIPIVVLTGLRDREMGLEALRQGADEYLVKDEINPGLLVRSIYHAIERKAHEREQKRYETLIEESTDVNAILDTDGSISYVTPSVEYVLGYDQDEMVDEDAFEYIHPEDAEEAKSEFEKTVTDPGYRASAEFRFRDADDDWVVLHARGRNLMSDPSIEGVVVYTHDITDLKEYERQLEQQRERLEALNQLNGVVQGITEAVIEQSTREEIEQVACERLAASDSYEFAWIGERSGSDVTVRASAGVDGYLDEVDISTNPEDETSKGPTGKALQTGEIQTTLDIRSDPSYEPWRETADEYGFQSSAAVPIRHEDTIYGVLNIYADRPDAFRGEERTVIDHLGEIVGHAIVAAERKQALMSDAVVELEIGIPDVFRAGEGGLAEDPIRIERAVPVTDDEFLLYGTTSEAAVEKMVAYAEQEPGWEEVTTVSETPDGVRFELRLSEPPVLSVVASVGGSVEEAVIEGGDYRLTIHLPQGTDVQGVLNRIQETYPQANALARRQVTRSDDPARRLTRAWMDDLTDRQRTALEAAYFSGIFEWPRHSSGEEVAESLGVSSPTFHQHVRAAEKKIFGALLEDSSFDET